MKISLAESESEVRVCHTVISELRPHVTVDELVRQTQEAGNSQGYFLAFAEDEDEVVAVAGFRIGRSLAWGKFLYVDDLVVQEKARANGYGSGLFDWLVSFGRQHACKQLRYGDLQPPLPNESLTSDMSGYRKLRIRWATPLRS